MRTDMKCDKCIWADKRPGNHVMCPVIRCVFKRGWWVDKQNKKKGENNERTKKPNAKCD